MQGKYIKLLGLLLILVQITACFPGEKKVSQKQSQVSKTSIAEIMALSMTQTLENEMARLQEYVQSEIIKGNDLTTALQGFPLSTSGQSPIGLGMCDGENTGMYAFIQQQNINGLGNLSQPSVGEKIRAALITLFNVRTSGTN